MPDQPLDNQQLAQLRKAIASGDPGRAMPALAGLREVAPDQAIPLLLLGLEQEVFTVRSLSCAGLGIKQSPEGWTALERALVHDQDPNVRAEAANALVSYSLERAWPLLIGAFTVNDHWLVRCSILSAVAERTEAPSDWLLQLARPDPWAAGQRGRCPCRAVGGSPRRSSAPAERQRSPRRGRRAQ